MCFSATASFGAGALLSTVGIMAIRKSRGTSVTVFASIPMIFAVQQIAEGFLWLTFSAKTIESLQEPLTHIFLFFAQVIWPLFVPISILYLEKKSQRKKIQKLLVGIGIVISAFLAFCLIFYPVHAVVEGKHIAYIQDYPWFSRYGGVLYVIATVTPPFFSRFKGMKSLSLMIFISYLITTIFYKDYIVSVWCFFASVISLVVYLIIREMRTSSKMIYWKQLNS